MNRINAQDVADLFLLFERLQVKLPITIADKLRVVIQETAEHYIGCTTDTLEVAIRTVFKGFGRIRAIKEYRDRTGQGLKEAIKYVDKHCEDLKNDDNETANAG